MRSLQEAYMKGAGLSILAAAALLVLLFSSGCPEPSCPVFPPPPGRPAGRRGPYLPCEDSSRRSRAFSRSMKRLFWREVISSRLLADQSWNPRPLLAPKWPWR